MSTRATSTGPGVPPGIPETSPRDRGICVRPAWQEGAPELSQRALSLLVAEWRARGLIDLSEDDHDPLSADTPGLLLGEVQRREAVRRITYPTTIAPQRRAAPAPLRLVTSAGSTPPGTRGRPASRRCPGPFSGSVNGR